MAGLTTIYTGVLRYWLAFRRWGQSVLLCATGSTITHSGNIAFDFGAARSPAFDDDSDFQPTCQKVVCGDPALCIRLSFFEATRLILKSTIAFRILSSGYTPGRFALASNEN